jgi:hypothetical protein
MFEHGRQFPAFFTTADQAPRHRRQPAPTGQRLTQRYPFTNLRGRLADVLANHLVTDHVGSHFQCFDQRNCAIDQDGQCAGECRCLPRPDQAAGHRHGQQEVIHPATRTGLTHGQRHCDTKGNQ